MTRGRLILAGSAILGIALVAAWWASGGQGWVAVHTGTVNEPGPYYGFWSGFGSDLGELTLVVAIGAPLLAVWRTHTCHRYWWCWRRPLHQLEGTPYKLCHVHHPDDIESVSDAVGRVGAA
jgi:hypothetical protein